MTCSGRGWHQHRRRQWETDPEVDQTSGARLHVGAGPELPVVLQTGKQSTIRCNCLQAREEKVRGREWLQGLTLMAVGRLCRTMAVYLSSSGGKPMESCP